MSKAAKSSVPAPETEAELPFEAALGKLEAIVEAMEGEELPLETLLARYEEGVKLVEFCQQKLNTAAVKIQKLEQSTGGEAALRPFPVPEATEQD